MPLPFLAWSIDTIRSVLESTLAPNTERNHAFIDGDHWQDGRAWRGPKPDPGDPDASRVTQLIQEGFCSSNAIEEVVSRHAGGVLGREPVWGFTPIRSLKAGEEPTEDEQNLIDEIEALITEWWNNKKAQTVLLEALRKALWAKHGPVRCFVPSGRLAKWTVKGRNEEGEQVDVVRAGLRIQRGDMRAALDNIFVESPDPENSAVYKDVATQVEVGITRYEVLRDENDPNSSTVEVFEMVWIDEDTGQTVFRIVDDDGGDEVVRLDMGGHRTILSIDRKPIITNQVIENQEAMNVALTLSPKNMADASFLEKTFLNAKMPGYEEEYLDPVTKQKRKRWVRTDYVSGPGAVNFVNGHEVDNPDGTTTLTTPQLIHRAPTSLEPIFQGADFHYVQILKQTNQTHVLKNEEGRASGKSHEQARVDYNISLHASKEPVDDTGRHYLGAVTAWAEVLAGVVGKYTSVLRPFFESQLDLGPISQDERNQNRQDVEAGLMDDETAMARSGILDVDKTKAIIATRPDARLKLLERLANIAQKMGGKVPVSVLAQLAKFDEDEIAALKKAEEEEQKRQDKIEKDKAKLAIKTPASGGGGSVRPLPTRRTA